MDWFLRMLHFVIWAANGIYYPFVNVYYRGLGLSGTQIGLIATVGPLLGIVTTMLSGVLIDRLGRPKMWFAITVLGSAVSAFALGEVETFPWILTWSALLSFFFSPILPLVSTVTLQYLGRDSAEFGEFRMWGTIGFIVTCSTSGFIWEVVGLRWLFSSYAVWLLLFLVMVLKFAFHKPETAPNALARSGQMVRKPAWLIFAGAVFLLNMVTVGGSNFVPVKVSDMGGQDWLVGMMFTVAALTEIPFFLFSRPLLRRFGPSGLMAISFVGYAVRFLGYSLIPAPEWVLAVNLIHGVTFVPYMVGSVAVADEMASGELRTTSQALLAAVSSIASVSGAYFGGRLFDIIGVDALLHWMALVCLLAGGVFALRKLVPSSQVAAVD